MKKGITTSDESKLVTKQHTKPCHDCPWRKASLPGWLGGTSAEDWVKAGHGDDPIECHTRHAKKHMVQCAGVATYRANVCKTVRPDAFRFFDVVPLTLPKDKEKVFASPMEFLKHHKSGKS